MKVFEESWEVCNKVGGIYTVISTKAKYLVDRYGKDYFLVGPFIKNNIEYVEEDLPDFLSAVYSNLANRGIYVHYGYWDIDGRPQVILLDFYEFFKKEVNYWKYKYWEWYRIDSLGSDYTYDEPFAWSVAVGMLLEELDRIFGDEKKILHAHEWLSGGTVLYIKSKGLRYKTIFTIHGTVLGRTISSKNIDVLDVLNRINPDQDAYTLGIHYKHQMEKAAVKYSDIFTVVSSVLAIESERFFGRSPKVIYNAILTKDRDVYKDYESARKWLEEFLIWYFYPYYYLDIRNTLFIYTIGRYEYYNKGLDLIIRIAKRLNEIDIGKDIVLFIFVPTGITGVSKNVMKLYSSYNMIKEILREKEREIAGYILRNNYEGLKGLFEGILPKISKSNRPDIVTHELYDRNDMIYNELKKYGLDNEETDRVKVVYVPVYIGQDMIFSLPKEKLLPGFDLGIFLSRYEPFGYTALESLYFGVPIVLSNRTGFALSLENNGIKSDYILLVDVKNIDKEEERIIEFIKRISMLTPSEFIRVREELYNISKIYDWGIRIKEYISLYEAEEG